MHTESSEPPGTENPRLERAIVLQLLRDDREEPWSHAELRTELGVTPSVLKKALRRLRDDEILFMSDRAAWASHTTRRLDELGLIGI
jgi:DNA-binding HxlR family transcriptional regulator